MSRSLSSCLARPRRLARPRTPPFHGDNTGSNPVGDAKDSLQSQPESMRKVFGIAVLILLAFIAIVLVMASMKPNTFQVQRSIVVNAPPERIAALIQDFHHWPRWTPEDKADSSFKR